MLRIGTSTPTFVCDSLQGGRIVELEWDQIHEEKTLILLFESLAGDDDAIGDLAMVVRAADRFQRLGAKVAAVCRNEPYEIAGQIAQLAGEGCQLPAATSILCDPVGQVSSLFDMVAADGGPMWGHCIIDPYGFIRQVSRSDMRVGVSVDELLRCVEAISRPQADWPC